MDNLEICNQAAAAAHDRVARKAHMRGAPLVRAGDRKGVHVPDCPIVPPGEEGLTGESAIEQATPTDNMCTDGSETLSDR